MKVPNILISSRVSCSYWERKASWETHGCLQRIGWSQQEEVRAQGENREVTPFQSKVVLQQLPQALFLLLIKGTALGVYEVIWWSLSLP